MDSNNTADLAICELPSRQLEIDTPGIGIELNDELPRRQLEMDTPGIGIELNGELPKRQSLNRNTPEILGCF
jgi:hypothetical protein